MASTELDNMKERHRAEVEEQIEALRPTVEKYEELVEYRESAFGSSPRGRRSTRTRSGASGDRSEANRPEQFLKAVAEAPGASIPEITKWINEQPDNDKAVNANYLYRVRNDLVKDGSVRQEGNNRHYLTEKGAEQIGVKLDAPAKSPAKRAPAAA